VIDASISTNKKKIKDRRMLKIPATFILSDLTVKNSGNCESAR
jgi:hypothetical protein